MSNTGVEEGETEIREPDDVDPEDVLGVFELIDCPAVTAGDVKTMLGCSTEKARGLLEELRSKGKIRRRRSSAAYLYWRVASDEEAEIPDYYRAE